MHRTGLGAILLVAASSLVTQIGCVFSAPTSAMEAVEPPSPEERLADLEAEVAALEVDAAAALAGLSASRAAAMSAEELAGAAQAETARAQTAATAAETAASEAQAESARAQTAAAAAEIAASEARAESAQARAAAVAAAVAAETALTEVTRTSSQPEVAVLIQDLQGRRVELPAGLDLRLLNLDSALVSVVGPDSIYLSGISHGAREFTARLRYPGVSAIPDLDFSTPALKALAPDTLEVSNLGIGGAAYSFALRVSPDGAISITRKQQGHRVRSSAELLRDELASSDVNRLVSGFGAGNALPGEGTWSTSAAGAVSQTDAEASHAKFAIHNLAQPEVVTLYGVTARADGGAKAGYGLHFLASGTPRSGNTWNFGHSYLIWATQEQGFYDSDETQVQLYESLDGNRLVWRKSRNVAQRLSSALTLEALYDPDDCPETMQGAPCHGSITVLVNGAEQFQVAVSPDIAGRAADTVALRALGGPVEFTDLYVFAR